MAGEDDTEEFFDAADKGAKKPAEEEEEEAADAYPEEPLEAAEASKANGDLRAILVGESCMGIGMLPLLGLKCPYA